MGKLNRLGLITGLLMLLSLTFIPTTKAFSSSYIEGTRIRRDSFGVERESPPHDAPTITASDLRTEKRKAFFVLCCFGTLFIGMALGVKSILKPDDGPPHIF